MTDTLGAGTRLAERYQIEDVIGRGRSPVYRARDVRLNRDVAVKEVGLATGTTGTTGGADRARALREARSAARVLSPAVVQVYDVVEERSALWLVMELVRAPSLDRLVSERGPLDEARAARVGLGVLDALEVAHAQGVVHRDVRPANVLVADLDDAAIEVPVKLGDFGLAALRDDTSVTAPGAVSGSAAYTAPEQAAGRRAGPAADLWALGAVLYFAVEGAAPFPGDSPKDVAAAVVQGAVRPQQRPGRLSRIIEMLLDTHPERRPDAGRVRAVLRSVVSGTEAADDTVEAPAGPAGPAGAAGAGDVDPTAVAGGAVGADATRVAGPAAEGAGAGTTGVAVATQVGGGPAVVGPGPHHEPAAASAAGRKVAVRPRPPVPYLLAAGAAAAALALVGLAVLRSGGGDDRGPDQTDAPVTTAEVDGSDTPPAQDRLVPPEGDDPPATAPDNGGDGPADVPGTSERDEGPGTTAPDTTTTVTSEDDTTTTSTSTTAPSTSTSSTGPTTPGTASTTVPGTTTGG